MGKKKQVMLWHILIVTVLFLILQTLGAETFDRLDSAGRWVRLAFHLMDYLIIGYDILKRRSKASGMDRYLMKISLRLLLPWVPWHWQSMKMVNIWKLSLSCFFIRWVNGSRVMELEEAAATYAICGW